MNALTTTLTILAGLALGLALAAVHAFATRRAAQASLAAASVPRLLLGFPLRVAAPAGTLFVLALWSPWALVGGVFAFAVGQRVLVHRLSTATD